jgi:hypothetical protein
MALGYGLDDRGFGSQKRLGIFLVTTESRSDLGPTQPPIEWVPGVLSLWVKLPGREADHSPPSSAEVKNAWSCTSAPQIPLHGVVLSLKNRVSLPFLTFGYLVTLFQLLSLRYIEVRIIVVVACFKLEFPSFVGRD